jgi:hypothetical protein
MEDIAPPKRFSDFAREHVPLDGAKLKIDDIINKEITVTGYRFKDSKFTKDTVFTWRCKTCCLYRKWGFVGSMQIIRKRNPVLGNGKEDR